MYLLQVVVSAGRAPSARSRSPAPGATWTPATHARTPGAAGQGTREDNIVINADIDI